MIVVVIALLFQVAEDCFRIGIRPIGEKNHVFLVKLDRIFLPPLDNQCTKQPRLLLKPTVAVIPVGTALHHWYAVEERLTGRNAGKAQPGNSVHIRRETYCMPVY